MADVDSAVMVAFVITVFLISVAPGPDMLFIVANAAVGGRRAGVVAAIGMSTGMVVHTLAAVVGLSALIAAAPVALNVVRLVGALFLVYLAITSWRSSRATPPVPSPADIPPPRRPLRKVYVMATLTNVANPKIVLFYLAFLPQFLSAGQAAWPAWLQMMTLGGLFIAVGLLVDITVGLIAGTLAERVLHRLAVRRWLERASALIFGGLAVRLALESQ